VRVLIADDEAPARARLAELVADADDDFEVVAEAANGYEVVETCRAGFVDLVLLDIGMPGVGGIEAAMALVELPHPPAVVFVTAYHEHALAAFDANAIDYLLKPVRPDRLLRALHKARVYGSEQLAALHDGAWLNVTYRGAVSRIPADDVVLLRADRKYVEVWHRGGMALTEESLRAIEERLPRRFFRVHRNALVAPGSVRALRKGDRGQLHLLLEDCAEQVEVSRRHAAEVRRLLRGDAG
jgi:two-component system response regulator AlgR